MDYSQEGGELPLYRALLNKYHKNRWTDLISTTIMNGQIRVGRGAGNSGEDISAGDLALKMAADLPESPTFLVGPFVPSTS